MIFSVMFCLIALFSIGFELLRGYFYARLEERQRELTEALEKVKTLGGLIPICSICKKIRDDRGYWNQLETYLASHTDATFSHGVCDDCLKTRYPEVYAKRQPKPSGQGAEEPHGAIDHAFHG
jgi:hypothetical protein